MSRKNKKIAQKSGFSPGVSMGVLLCLAILMTHASPVWAVPAISSGWGVYTMNDANGTQLWGGVDVINHAGVADDGSSHTVTMRGPDGSSYTLNFEELENSTRGDWEIWEYVPPLSGDYRFTVRDSHANTATATDTLVVSLLSPADTASISPNVYNEPISAVFDNVVVNGSPYETFDAYNTIDDLDETKWIIPWCVNLDIQNQALSSTTDNTAGCALLFANPEAISAIQADITVAGAASDRGQARIVGYFYGNGENDVAAGISVFRDRVEYWVVEVIGGETASLNILVQEDLMTVSTGQAITAVIDWDGQTLTFAADNNTAVYTPTGTVTSPSNSAKYLETRIWLLTSTSPTITWDPVAGANHYHIRILDNTGSNTIYRGHYAQSTTHRIPPGILQPNAIYLYRIEARDNHNPLEVDNTSRSPDIAFRTGAQATAPMVALNNYGVAVWNSDLEDPFLDVSIRIHDAQGVPGNIAGVSMTLPDGTSQRLYYDPANDDNTATCGIYKADIHGYTASGTYTFTVRDKEDNSHSTTEELNADPIGYPPLSSLSPVRNSVLNTTAVDFDWADVTGAAFYEVKIYDQNLNQVENFYTTQSEFSLPEGFLAPDTLYRYRINIRREFYDQNVDNQSAMPWGSWTSPHFFTGAVSGGTAGPQIDLNNMGASIYYMADDEGERSRYWLVIEARISDADGVPGNIQAVQVTCPSGSAFQDGSTTQILWMNRQDSTTEAIYEYSEHYDDPAAIPAGTYTFTVTDFEGHSAQATDTLVKNVLPTPTNLAPTADATVEGIMPTISWDAVPGAVCYRVRIYDGWNATLHWSDYLTTTSYSVPPEVLTEYTTYSYRVYAYAEDPSQRDVDNISVVGIGAYDRLHFTTGAYDVDLDKDAIFDNVDNYRNNALNIPLAATPLHEAALGDVTEAVLESVPFDNTSARTHVTSHWRVRRADWDYGADTYDPSFNLTSTTELNQHTVAGLEAGLQYKWQVGYEDDSGTIDWSREYAFSVGTAVIDGSVKASAGSSLEAYKMVSFVQWPDDSRAGSVFDVDYESRNFRIGAWDPDAGAYVECDQNLYVEPGKAYWLLARNDHNPRVSGVPVSMDHDLDVRLGYNPATGDGWNMIACPNRANYRWADLQVVVFDAGGNIVFGPTAIADLGDPNDYIDMRLWRWQAGAYLPDTTVLERHGGYWVRAKQANVSLRFRRAVQQAARGGPESIFLVFLNRSAGHFKAMWGGTREARAQSTDYPPMPMGTLTPSEHAMGGCFIEAVAQRLPFGAAAGETNNP
jgi:hypothetical protein